jgi:hypothetical protein
MTRNAHPDTVENEITIGCDLSVDDDLTSLEPGDPSERAIR